MSAAEWVWAPRTAVGTSITTRPPVREVRQDRLALEVLTPAGDRVLWRAEAREPRCQSLAR